MANSNGINTIESIAEDLARKELGISITEKDEMKQKKVAEKSIDFISTLENKANILFIHIMESNGGVAPKNLRDIIIDGIANQISENNYTDPSQIVVNDQIIDEFATTVRMLDDEIKDEVKDVYSIQDAKVAAAYDKIFEDNDINKNGEINRENNFINQDYLIDEFLNNMEDDYIHASEESKEDVRRLLENANIVEMDKTYEAAKKGDKNAQKRVSIFEAMISNMPSFQTNDLEFDENAKYNAVAILNVALEAEGDENLQIIINNFIKIRHLDNYIIIGDDGKKTLNIEMIKENFAEDQVESIENTEETLRYYTIAKEYIPNGVEDGIATKVINRDAEEINNAIKKIEKSNNFSDAKLKELRQLAMGRPDGFFQFLADNFEIDENEVISATILDAYETLLETDMQARKESETSKGIYEEDEYTDETRYRFIEKICLEKKYKSPEGMELLKTVLEQDPAVAQMLEVTYGIKPADFKKAEAIEKAFESQIERTHEFAVNNTRLCRSI